jgi:hypothetical protein
MEKDTIITEGCRILLQAFKFVDINTRTQIKRINDDDNNSCNSSTSGRRSKRLVTVPFVAFFLGR